MSKWEEGKLSDIANIDMGQSPKGETCNPNGTGTPLLNGPTEFGFKFPVAVQFTIDPRKVSKVGDILFCVRGSTTGRMNWGDKPYAIGRGLAAIRHKKGIEYQHFVKGIMDYQLPSLLQGATGSTFPNVSTTELNNLPLQIPSDKEQLLIAELLSSLNGKIDLLYCQNGTIEQLAKVFFRQFFLEEADVYWEEVAFSDFFDFLEGPGIRNWQYTLSGTPFINIRLIDKGEIDISKASYVSNEEANGSYKHFLLQENDMIVSTSGTLGKTAIVRTYHLPLMLNTSVIRFRPKDGKSHAFVYQYLQSKKFQEHLEAAASGSVQSNFGPTHLKQMTLAKPPQEVLQKYLDEVDPLYEKIKSNYNQIRTLTRLRDTLLPKLMSGEVRVH